MLHHYDKEPKAIWKDNAVEPVCAREMQGGAPYLAKLVYKYYN